MTLTRILEIAYLAGVVATLISYALNYLATRAELKKMCSRELFNRIAKDDMSLFQLILSNIKNWAKIILVALIPVVNWIFAVGTLCMDSKKLARELLEDTIRKDKDKGIYYS